MPWATEQTLPKLPHRVALNNSCEDVPQNSKCYTHIRQTFHTIFSFNLSFQLWENANNEFSRPQRVGNLLYSIISFLQQQTLQLQQSLTLESEQRWWQIGLMNRDADIPVSNISTPGISHRNSWGEIIQWRE